MHDALPEQLGTSRLSLRRPRPEDAQAMFDGWTADPETTRFLAWRPHRTVAETRVFLRGVEAEWQRGSGAALLIFAHTDAARPLGMIHPRRRGHVVRTGYVLRRSAWGNGIAAEALRALTDAVLAHPAIFRAEAFCDAENPASARVMEKAGMTCEARLRRWFIHPNLSPDPRDCLFFARTR
ncbi:GNAT family N-acetyltransferase [Sagittula salina]|uniref:GNAT family N-acetyltransferase n=1 Tax=Sagittula salina TaxID=2820268 RepID=A0A940MY55_9RHOB|nr:GNAT family N-acetyltransferase [Sagittula salina]MBP0484979.1 GNAT family N-acetyltransferase [Sagittula salina]